MEYDDISSNVGFILLSQSSDFIHSSYSVPYMQLYKRYNTAYNKCVQISLNTYVNKKNLILKVKKNRKAQRVWSHYVVYFLKTPGFLT